MNWNKRECSAAVDLVFMYYSSVVLLVMVRTKATSTLYRLPFIMTVTIFECIHDVYQSTWNTNLQFCTSAVDKEESFPGVKLCIASVIITLWFPFIGDVWGRELLPPPTSLGHPCVTAGLPTLLLTQSMLPLEQRYRIQCCTYVGEYSAVLFQRVPFFICL
jgi:hypothetical protein